MILLSGFLFLTSCSKTQGKTKENNSEASVTTPVDNTNDNASSVVDVTIGILPAESSIPLILAKEQGFFEAEGLNVTLQTFSSPNDRNAAVSSRELDATIGDIMTSAAFVDKAIPMKITSDISEDFKILSSPNSGITELAQLSGKKISLVPNFILEYIMDQFANTYGFEYEIVEIPSFSGRSEALLSDQIDGVVFTEPQAGMLVTQGAHLLGSSKEAKIKGGTIMFTDDMITAHPEAIKAFYVAYNKAIDYMNENNVSEYRDLLAQYQFPEAISDYLTSQNGNFQHATSIDQEQFTAIIEWTLNKEMISRSYSYEELTNFSFLE